MDRFEEMQYQIATDSVGLAIGASVATLIAAAVARAKIKNKISEGRKKKYDKEKASGNISEKTMKNANKVYAGGRPYPEYVEMKEKVSPMVPKIKEFIDTAQEQMLSDIKKFCDTKKEFHPLAELNHKISVSNDDILDAILQQPSRQHWIAVFRTIAMESLKECLNVALTSGDTDDAEDFSQLRFIAGDNDIEHMKQAGMTVLDVAMGKIYQICTKYMNECIGKINSIKDLPGQAKLIVDDNPDDVYRTYGIVFR